MTPRNALCPCGSGKKFKRCHGSVSGKSFNDAVLEAKRKMGEMAARRGKHSREFGAAREPVSTTFGGQMFVAVGGALYSSSKWKTFPDFLNEYVQRTLGPVFGAGWYAAERQKEPAMRHPIVRWYEAFCALGLRAQRGTDGLLRSQLDGQAHAHFNLAYDLFVVADNARVQQELLRRMRDARNGFQGARYELAVIATMVRAGFMIEYEDETDNSRRHPEFVGVHRQSGLRVAVEAKSRRRPGVMGWVGSRPKPDKVELGVGALLADAIEKYPRMAYVIFIDANLDPTAANIDSARWLSEVDDTVHRLAHGIGPTGVFEGVPFSLLCVTNFPYDYANPGEVSGDGRTYMKMPQMPAFPVPSSIVRDIEGAIRVYGNIPQNFL